jgi:hypothetical protein
MPLGKIGALKPCWLQKNNSQWAQNGSHPPSRILAEESLKAASSFMSQTKIHQPSKQYDGKIAHMN